MRFALSACFALALLAGNTGCCLFCRPLFPCLARHQCDDCGDMGCQRAPIFNWSRCCDTCDHCGDWTGQSIVARTGGGQQQAPYVTAARRAQPRNVMASRVVPGTYREVTTLADSGDEVTDESVVADEGPALVAEAPRPKRVRTAKSRSRSQVVRAQQVE